MTNTEIIERLRTFLERENGRHLYAVIGDYAALDVFATQLVQAHYDDTHHFPGPISVNDALLDELGDAEFRKLSLDEPRYPEKVYKRINELFEQFLTGAFKTASVVVLHELEMLFVYRVELGPLRNMASDQRRLILLLPGKVRGERIEVFADDAPGFELPADIFAREHRLELQ